jgi:hypothetical protein
MQVVERELRSLTPEQRAAVESAMVAGKQNERATRSEAPPPGSERLDGDVAVGVNGWGDRLDKDRFVGDTVGVPAAAPALVLPSLQDAPPIVDTSVPSQAAKVREGMVLMLDDTYAEAYPDAPVPPEGLVDGWIEAHPLDMHLPDRPPEAWSARRAFGVDATASPPVFVFGDGTVWAESAPGFWDIKGHIRMALDTPLAWAVHQRGRAGYAVIQMALVGDRLRLMGSDLGRSGLEDRSWPVQEALVAGWAPAFQDGQALAQTVLVTPDGLWLVRVVSPTSGATAFVRLDPEGGTPPEATGVLRQEFVDLDTWSSLWEAPEEAWGHLPETLSAVWNAPANWPMELGHIWGEDEVAPDAFMNGRLAFAMGASTSPAWALGVGILATEAGTRKPASIQDGTAESFFAAEVALNRAPAITGFPGGDAVAMWIPRNAQTPDAWVAGVEEAHVLDGKPLPSLRRVAFTLPHDAGLPDILRIERAHVWPDGAALLRAELVGGRRVDLLWHMPSGAVVLLGR